MNNGTLSLDAVRHLLEGNLAGIRRNVAEATRRSGRETASVTILAATKTVAPGVVALLPALGIRDVGENRVQEAESKVHALSDPGLRWHMIGHLQTNKVRRAFDLFAKVHSVDGVAVMDALAKEAARRGRVADCLLQVNVSAEATKGGFGFEDAAEALRRARSLPSLRVTGLMAIPAPATRPGQSRAAFRAVRELRDRLRASAADLPDLSMGMSDDYAEAVEEGSTILRLGSAIFGGLPADRFGRGVA